MQAIIEEIEGRVAKALTLLRATASDAKHLHLSADVLTRVNEDLAQVVRFAEQAESEVWTLVPVETRTSIPEGLVG